MVAFSVMSRSYRLLILLTCLALAFAGLPAHACVGMAAEAETAASEIAAAEQPPCPHHDAVASEPAPNHAEPANPADETNGCGVHCTCGCGAPAPVLTVATNAEAVALLTASSATVATLDPSPAPDRLLRPPKRST